jgi:hypothetical protein
MQVPRKHSRGKEYFKLDKKKKLDQLPLHASSKRLSDIG